MNAVRMPPAFAPMQSNAWLATKRTLEGVGAEVLAGRRIGRAVRLEVAGLLDRDHRVEGEPDVRFRGLEHVAVAVREDREAVASAQPFERLDHVGEGFQAFDAADEPAHLVAACGRCPRAA